MDAQLLPTEAAAARLGLQPKTLHQWRSLGRGPKFVKLGGPRLLQA